jgi:hypothetical protein
MPSPFAPKIDLDPEQRQKLESLSCAGSTPQALARRIRIVLRAAGPDDPSNVRIAGELGSARHTVALWRSRYAEDGLAGLQDAPRSGRPPVFSPRGTAPGHLHRHQRPGGPGLVGHPLVPR